MRVGYLKKDSEERFNLKRSWRVNAWRIVDAQGEDMVQPWSRSKSEAIATAKQLGIRIPKITVEVQGGLTTIRLMPEFRLPTESAVYFELKVELQRQGYDCIKTSPQRDGQMTSAPFYVRARDKSWCILDDNHALRCPAEVLNKERVISLRNFWSTPAPKGNNDQQRGVFQAAVGQQQGGPDPNVNVGAADLS